MKTKLFFATMLSVVIFGSCNNDPDIDGVVFSKSYIQPYILTDELNLKQADYLPKNSIRAYFNGNTVSGGTDYEQLAVHFNDVSFNRDIVPYGRPALADEFTVTEIISDTDFDGTHPAGTSLTDIFMFHGTSVKRYIESGYKNMFDWSNYEYKSEYSSEGKRARYPVRKLVSELTAGDMELLDPNFFLTPTVSPTIKQHALTVTFRNADKTVTGTIDAVFE